MILTTSYLPLLLTNGKWTRLLLQPRTPRCRIIILDLIMERTQYPNHILPEEDSERLKRRAQGNIRSYEENKNMDHHHVYAAIKETSLMDLEEAELGYAYKKRQEAFSAALPQAKHFAHADKVNTLG